MSLSAALKTAAESIRQIHAKRTTPIDKNPASPVVFSRGELGAMALEGDAAESYRTALFALWKAVRSLELHSRIGVSAALQTAILQACRNGRATAGVSFDLRVTAAINEPEAQSPWRNVRHKPPS